MFIYNKTTQQKVTPGKFDFEMEDENCDTRYQKQY